MTNSVLDTIEVREGQFKVHPLHNAFLNVLPTMKKLKGNTKLTRDDKQNIIEFYLEIGHYMSDEADYRGE